MKTRGVLSKGSNTKNKAKSNSVSKSKSIKQTNYRDSHNLGRRRSAESVVTYSLDSRLFFDVYAKFSDTNVKPENKNIPEISNDNESNEKMLTKAKNKRIKRKISTSDNAESSGNKKSKDDINKIPESNEVCSKSETFKKLMTSKTVFKKHLSKSLPVALKNNGKLQDKKESELISNKVEKKNLRSSSTLKNFIESDNKKCSDESIVNVPKEEINQNGKITQNKLKLKKFKSKKIIPKKALKKKIKKSIEPVIEEVRGKRVASLNAAAIISCVQENNRELTKKVEKEIDDQINRSLHIETKDSLDDSLTDACICSPDKLNDKPIFKPIPKKYQKVTKPKLSKNIKEPLKTEKKIPITKLKNVKRQKTKNKAPVKDNESTVEKVETNLNSEDTKEINLKSKESKNDFAKIDENKDVLKIQESKLKDCKFYETEINRKMNELSENNYKFNEIKTPDIKTENITEMNLKLKENLQISKKSFEKVKYKNDKSFDIFDKISSKSSDKTSNGNISDDITPISHNNASKSDMFFDITSKPMKKPKSIIDENNLNKKSEITKSIEINSKKTIKKRWKKVFGDPEVTDEIKDDNSCLWNWVGDGNIEKIQLKSKGPFIDKLCYQSIKHIKDNIIINVNDCVLLKSDDQEPFIGNISHFYYDPQEDKKMLVMCWYYRPENTELGRQDWHGDDDLYASYHLDVNCVDCIDDRAFVLPIELYGRYAAFQKRQLTSTRSSLVNRLIPHIEEEKQIGSTNIYQENDLSFAEQAISKFYSWSNLLHSSQNPGNFNFPYELTTSTNVFVCRGFYDIFTSHITHHLPKSAWTKPSNQQVTPNASNVSISSDTTSPQKLSSSVDNLESLISPPISQKNTPLKPILVPQSKANTDPDNTGDIGDGGDSPMSISSDFSPPSPHNNTPIVLPPPPPPPPDCPPPPPPPLPKEDVHSSNINNMSLCHNITENSNNNNIDNVDNNETPQIQHMCNNSTSNGY